MALGRKDRKKILLAKIEVTPGTDPAPTPLADAVLTKGLAFQDWQGDTEARNTDRPTLGNELVFHTKTHAMVTFQVDFVGHGSAADSEPPWDTLLRCCSVASTNNPGTSVVYTPIDENQETCTLHFMHDGTLHVMNYCQGNARIVCNAGTMPYFEFTFMGLRQDAQDFPIPSSYDVSAYQTPVPVNQANSKYSLAGLISPDIRMQAFELNLGTQIVHRDLVNFEGIEITDRLPSGSVTIEDGLVADYDWDATIGSHTPVASSFVHEPNVVGRTLTIDSPKVQLRTPTMPNLDGNIGRQMAMNLIPDAGLDEWSITQT